jgi:hypothetical protein
VVDAVEPYQRTSAARYNTAQRAEYASGLTDVPSASTSTRPVSGYLINDSAEPDQLRGLPDGHGVWSRCVASGGSLDGGRDVVAIKPSVMQYASTWRIALGVLSLRVRSWTHACPSWPRTGKRTKGVLRT